RRGFTISAKCDRRIRRRSESNIESDAARSEPEAEKTAGFFDSPSREGQCGRVRAELACGVVEESMHGTCARLAGFHTGRFHGLLVQFFAPNRSSACELWPRSHFPTARLYQHTPQECPWGHGCAGPL